ncbi:MAG TPA: hypothetical protein VNF99_04590 [Stellaceae bacterium]|nr:hypothetical protein [Stellaceae bacterium]
MPSLSQKRDAERAKLRAFTTSEDDPHEDLHGVLLSDEIAFYARNHALITPFVDENLKPAAYELTLGDEYFLSGEFHKLESNDDNRNKIIIPPFQVAVLKTAEIISLPRYLIARWNIRVTHAYSGLLWVGGPQVDPGWVGHLFCPIYNLSDKPVTLHIGDPIAVMDFVKTTPFNKAKIIPGKISDLKRYNFPKRIILEDYGINDLRSALYTKAGAKLIEFEEDIKNLGTRFITFTQISFVMFALMISIIAVISRTNADNMTLAAAFWGAITLGISVAALILAIFANVTRRVGQLVYEQFGHVMAKSAQDTFRYFQRTWWIGFAISIVVAFGSGIAVYRTTQPALRDLRTEHVLLKSDFDEVTNSMSTHIDQVSARLDRLDATRTVTMDDLQKLKAVLEQEIEAQKSGLK